MNRLRAWFADLSGPRRGELLETLHAEGPPARDRRPCADADQEVLLDVAADA